MKTWAKVAPELGNGKVGVVGGLPPLMPHDAHSNVSCLDHGHIVGSIPDGQHAHRAARMLACNTPAGHLSDHGIKVIGLGYMQGLDGCMSM